MTMQGCSSTNRSGKIKKKERVETQIPIPVVSKLSPASTSLQIRIRQYREIAPVVKRILICGEAFLVLGCLII